MIIKWHESAWEEYVNLQSEDKKTIARVNKLIKEITRNGYNVIGKPEQLKGNFSSWWSCHIDAANRLIFRISDDDLEILSCLGHYNDK